MIVLRGVPIAIGGNNPEVNLVTLCNSCKEAVESNDLKKAVNMYLSNFQSI